MRIFYLNWQCLCLSGCVNSPLNSVEHCGWYDLTRSQLSEKSAHHQSSVLYYSVESCFAVLWDNKDSSILAVSCGHFRMIDFSFTPQALQDWLSSSEWTATSPVACLPLVFHETCIVITVTLNLWFDFQGSYAPWISLSLLEFSRSCSRPLNLLEKWLNCPSSLKTPWNFIPCEPTADSASRASDWQHAWNTRRPWPLSMHRLFPPLPMRARHCWFPFQNSSYHVVCLRQLNLEKCLVEIVCSTHCGCRNPSMLDGYLSRKETNIRVFAVCAKKW